MSYNFKIENDNRKKINAIAKQIKETIIISNQNAKVITDNGKVLKDHMKASLDMFKETEEKVNGLLSNYEKEIDENFKNSLLIHNIIKVNLTFLKNFIIISIRWLLCLIKKLKTPDENQLDMKAISK